MAEVHQPWDERRSGIRLVLRLIGVTFLAYLLVSAGALSGPRWVLAGSAVAMAAMLVLVFLRHREFDRWAIAGTLVMMVSGALVTPALNFLPVSFLVIGGAILFGQPRLPLRSSLVLAAVPALVLAVTVTLVQRDLSTLLAGLLGFVVIALYGANRRAARQQDGQNRELVTRSRELEQRSRQLITQTELTRAETARAAALEERHRIARDVHDVLAHSLGGLVVQLDAADALLSDHGDQVAAAGRIRASRQLAVDGLREARRAVNELRAPDEGGSTDLVADLAALVDGPVASQLGLGLDVAGEAVPVPARVGHALTSVCREAVTNASKHAPGGPATLSVIFEPDGVVLELVNAVGAAAGPLAESGAGVGIAGMRSRMREVAGTLTARPQNGRWVVRAEWRRA